MQFWLSFPYFLMNFRGIHGDSHQYPISTAEECEKTLFVSLVILPAVGSG